MANDEICITRKIEVHLHLHRKLVMRVEKKNMEFGMR